MPSAAPQVDKEKEKVKKRPKSSRGRSNRSSEPKPNQAVGEENGMKPNFDVILLGQASQFLSKEKYAHLRPQIQSRLDTLAVNPLAHSLKSHIFYAGSMKEGEKVYRSTVTTGSAGYRMHWYYGSDGTIFVYEITSHNQRLRND